MEASDMPMSQKENLELLFKLRCELATRETVDCGIMPTFEDLLFCGGTCGMCPLMRFIPEGKKEAASPCRYIVLNEEGQTIASLEAREAEPEVIESAIIKLAPEPSVGTGRAEERLALAAVQAQDGGVYFPAFHCTPKGAL